MNAIFRFGVGAKAVPYVTGECLSTVSVAAVARGVVSVLSFLRTGGAALDLCGVAARYTGGF